MPRGCSPYCSRRGRGGLCFYPLMWSVDGGRVAEGECAWRRSIETWCGGDLDPSDTGEVYRRVAKPAVSQLLHPDEFERCRVDVVRGPPVFGLFAQGDFTSVGSAPT